MNVETQRISPAPIRRDLRVKASRQKAFHTFVAHGRLVDEVATASPGSGQKDVMIEPRAGGRWYEIGNDGSEQHWGRVVAWEAPERVLLIWQLNGRMDLRSGVRDHRRGRASPRTATTRSSISSIATSTASARRPRRSAAITTPAWTAAGGRCSTASSARHEAA